MLIFDFDGVLINSIDEVTVSAYNVVTNQLVVSLEELPVNVVHRFKRNRFYVQSIGDVIPLMRWCMENQAVEPDFILNLQEYQAIIRRESIPLVERVNYFFKIRWQFAEKDEKRWLSLHAPFQPVWDALKTYSPDEVVILTNKDRQAVVHLCRHFGLEIRENNIYSGDKGVTKIENLNAVHQRFNRAPYHFIDDSLRNLRDLNTSFNQTRLLLRLILASWGYIGPDDERMTHAFGYSVFSQKDLIASLDQHFSESKKTA